MRKRSDKNSGSTPVPVFEPIPSVREIRDKHRAIATRERIARERMLEKFYGGNFYGKEF